MIPLPLPVTVVLALIMLGYAVFRLGWARGERATRDEYERILSAAEKADKVREQDLIDEGKKQIILSLLDVPPGSDISPFAASCAVYLQSKRAAEAPTVRMQSIGVRRS